MAVEITEEFVWQSIPHRARDSHKGTFGSVLAVAGSAFYRGAALLAAEGALRTGAGIVTLASVEPGIYFIPELIDLWRGEKKFMDFIDYDKVEEYRNFGGIRNEEDYLVTETGARRLGKKIPLTPEEVEALR